MDYDLVLVIGIVVAVLTIPSMMSAWMEGRAPRTATILLMAAGVMIVAALTQSPRPYTIAKLPHVFVEVIGRYTR